MRPELRVQLRRQKTQWRSSNQFWAQGSGIRIPWTVGQRKWMAVKVSASLNEVWSKLATQPKSPDVLVVDRHVYEAWQDALKSNG